MYFRDRIQAAELLAERLDEYRGHRPLILGIPRGSVPMAQVLSDRLKGDLDVVLVHKVGAPDNPEFAIGSVSEFGALYRSTELELYGVSPQDFEALAKEELRKLRNRREAYSPIRPPINPSNRVVIIVDDGIATGSTMLAAIRAVRSQQPKKIVIAAPVASPSAVELLREEVDELVMLDTPTDLFSISQFYEEFPQVTDDEVYGILNSAGKGAHGRMRAAA